METAVEIPIVSLKWNRYGKASAAQDAVIEVRVYYQKKVKYMSTRIRVFPKEWQRDHVVNRPDAMIINKQLDKLIVDVRKVIFEMYEEGRIEIDAIPSRLLAKRKQSAGFLDFCEERAKIRKYGKAEDSKERYDRFLRFLQSYGKFQTFYDLSEAKVMELDRYLRKKNMKAKSRWNNYHRFLNSFILDAKRAGLITINPYDNIRIEKGDDTEGLSRYLSPEEFQILRDVKLPTEKLERARDLFVFQCFTCMAYHDLALFSQKKYKEMLVDVLEGHRGKTKIEFIVPILDTAKAIIEKYHGLPILLTEKRKGKGEEKNVQYYNNRLKEVAAIAGIKHISSHYARHTGATMLLNAGVPIQYVSKVLGHASIRMTEKIYAKVLPKTVVSEVRKIENKL